MAHHNRTLGRYIGGLGEDMKLAIMVTDLAYMLSKTGYLPPGTYLTWTNDVASAYFAWVLDTLMQLPDRNAADFEIVAVSSEKTFVAPSWSDVLEILAMEAVQMGAETSYVVGMEGRMRPIPISEAPPAGAPGEEVILDIEKEKKTAWIPWAVGGAAILGIGWIVMKRKKG